MVRLKHLDLKKSVFIPGIILFTILFLLNGISKNWFFRWDLTNNDMYSLSTSSESVLKQVDDLLTMKVYFSDDLPGEYANNRRYLQDILEEYEALSDGNIRFEFFRPEDDKDIEQEAQKAGIMPVQMQVIENDKMEVKRVLMGMVILYEDKKEVLPVIQTTTGLEYEITTKIKKLVETDKPTVGIAQFEGQTNQFQNIQNVLRQRYNIRTVNLVEEVPADITAMLMSGVSDSLSENEAKHLKGFLKRGGNLFLTQNRVKTNLQIQQAFPIQSDIFSIIEPYGFNIEENLVTDRICGRVNVQQQMGPIRMNVPMEYPLLPVIRSFNTNEAIVAGLEQMQLVFASEIKQDSASMGQVNFVPLLFTSDQSGEMRGNYNLNPDPKQNPFLRMFNQSHKILGARSEKVDENGIISQVVLVGDSDFIADQGGGRSPENHIFVMNAVDFLIGDRDLIALRSREITSRPLEEVSDESKKTWKWVNITLPSLLIVGFGLIRIRQQKRRSDILEELYG
ncbi:MAG: GldG family protein [Candidatus Marinimicrobia bacterium]|nr:GldG family protein [Candidatus Neomarinimicrobiota bacterium]